MRAPGFYVFDERNLGGRAQARAELERFQRVVMSTKGTLNLSSRTAQAPLTMAASPKKKAARHAGRVLMEYKKNNPRLKDVPRSKWLLRQGVVSYQQT